MRGKSVSHLGFFCLAGRGHLYPATALGRRLRSDGFQVTMFCRPIGRAIVRASGLRFKPLFDISHQTRSVPVEIIPRYMGPHPIKAISTHARAVLTSGLESLADEKLDALLVDQADLAAGSVAEALGIPFISIALLPPVYLNDDTPPFIFGWCPRSDRSDSSRNRRGNNVMERLFASTVEEVNLFRRDHGLNTAKGINELFSRLAIVTQLPGFFDFPRTMNTPPIFYCGRFYDEAVRSQVAFPWSQLDGRRLVFACMGTARTSPERIVEAIASACAPLDVQLVISLGGMSLTPDMFRHLAGNPIVVHFAPQPDVLKRASLCITHGGINTVLESVDLGVPIVAIPITDDQPGVAARVAWKQIGFSIPARRATVEGLRTAITSALASDLIFRNVAKLGAKSRNIDGLKLASQSIQVALEAGPPS